ncbi:MAG: NAD(P)/FAD-dependent oxidoreductase [Armatimonadota bacterium]
MFKQSKKNYDVIIIGAGPAGIFAALELAKKSRKKVLLIDKGSSIKKRVCPTIAKGVECSNCKPCDILNGWGGAGAYSDGKLTLSTAIGGILDTIISKKQLVELIDYADKLYLKFGAKNVIYGDNEDDISELSRKASLAGLILIPNRLRHLGTDTSIEVLKNMENFLLKKIDILMDTSVKEIICRDNEVKGVMLDNGDIFESKYVIAAPGRQGARWLSDESHRLKLNTIVNPVDVGVRVETSADTSEPITEGIYESKFIYYSKHFDDKVRTFCMCPYGEVVSENDDGIITVNGHSYGNKKTKNTNFAILVSKNFTEPFKDPIAYGQYIARLGNLLAGKVMVQRLGDLQAGRRSTVERMRKSVVEPTLKEATPGDLSLVLPYRHLLNILEMLTALDQVAPGIASKNTLLYGVEIKSYSSQIETSKFLETQVNNLFACGDGAGITRGLMQASVSGIIAAQEIMRRK